MKNDRGLVGEVVVVFSLFMISIWVLPQGFGQCVGSLLTLAIIFISWRCRKDTLTDLGIQPKDFCQTKPIFVFISVSFVVIVLLATVVNPGIEKQSEIWLRIRGAIGGYIVWAFFQQLVFQGYFANRLYKASGNRIWPAAITSAAVFSLIHFPNPLLMIGTFYLGIGASYFFLKSRNLYLATLTQAILAPCWKWLILKALSTNAMRVGPGFWQ